MNDPAKIARLIDHTCLKPDATRSMIETLCEEALEYSFYSVCVNTGHIESCRDILKGSDVKICSVAGFPLGSSLTSIKAMEAKEAESRGANEIDMVINIGALKDGDLALVEDDIAAVVYATSSQVLTKVIIETCYLTDEQKITACRLAVEAGADFVKTSTGFGPSGATAVDVALMRRIVGDDIGVKAAGGIRDYETAIQMIEAGATRIGTSAGVGIARVI
ncbi:MAG: deoxyribose-phosphate aldolase [candidate division Zixibacteria bacterium]